ncbi:uncharacterized protein [Drosophila pseudoobscura]|uniref:Uncharacterized protein n=1 Tax=Drosophila pseudoobscura pseudoobscura TaxID=46245 RepID=A0A6I8V2U3_DROPS|nr:uncharacterized protein LOC6897309 [Drosophila pseudoobscura]
MPKTPFSPNRMLMTKDEKLKFSKPSTRMQFKSSSSESSSDTSYSTSASLQSSVISEKLGAQNEHYMLERKVASVEPSIYGNMVEPIIEDNELEPIACSKKPSVCRESVEFQMDDTLLDPQPSSSKTAKDFCHISSPWLIGDSQLKATDNLPHIKEHSSRTKANKMVQKIVTKTKANKMINTAQKRRKAARPDNVKKSRDIIQRLDKRLEAIQSALQSMIRFSVDDQPQPAVVPCNASKRNPENLPEVARNALLAFEETLVQEFFDVVSQVFSVNTRLFTCLVVLLLISVVLWFYKEEVWGPSTEEARYQAKMRKSGPLLKCLIFLLRQLNVPIF